MKVLVISKPIYDYVMPLVEFPKDGETFYIDKSINSLSNIGSLVAIALASYGLDVSFTGMVGEDYIGNKIKEIFGIYKIDTTYIETSYTEKTNASHKIYNSKTNKFTTIDELSLKSNLTKYKYEFIPDVIIMDDKDYQANLAAINNHPNALTIFIGEKYTKESSVYLNKCKYIISNLKFASDATGVVNDLNKPKNIITLFQKYVDIYNSNLIIKLDNFDILYCVDDEVRIIKNINKNISNKNNVFYSVLCYFLSLNIDIENSIKFTNKVMLSSKSELNMIENIPEYKIVSECLEEYKKNIEENKVIENIDSNGFSDNKENVETLTIDMPTTKENNDNGVNNG